MALTNFDPLLSGLGRFQAQKGPPSSSGSSPREIAQGFESLLIRQFLAAARSGALESSDQQESGWLEMADDAMAGFLASRGGLGLAGQVASLLEQGAKRRAQVSLDSRVGAQLDSQVMPERGHGFDRSSALNISRNSAVVPFGEMGAGQRLGAPNNAVTTQWDDLK